MDDRPARRFWLARKARHAPGKIVVPAGCAASARGGPGGVCRGAVPQPGFTKQGRNGTDVAEGHRGLRVRGSDGFSGGGLRAFKHGVDPSDGSGKASRHGGEQCGNRRGMAQDHRPCPRSGRAAHGTPLAPGSEMRRHWATCLGVVWRSGRLSRLAGRACPRCCGDARLCRVRAQCASSQLGNRSNIAVPLTLAAAPVFQARRTRPRAPSMGRARPSAQKCPLFLVIMTGNSGRSAAKPGGERAPPGTAYAVNRCAAYRAATWQRWRTRPLPWPSRVSCSPRPG